MRISAGGFSRVSTRCGLDCGKREGHLSPTRLHAKLLLVLRMGMDLGECKPRSQRHSIVQLQLTGQRVGQYFGQPRIGHVEGPPANSSAPPGAYGH